MTSEIRVSNIAAVGGTGAMTIDSTGLVTGGYLKPTSEGLVTTSSSQNNVELSVPSGCQRVELQLYKFKPSDTGETIIRMGNPSIFTTGYEATSTVVPNGSTGINTAITNGFRIAGYNAAANIFNVLGWGRSIDDGRRWHFNFEFQNTQYPTNLLETSGLIDMGVGNTLQKIQIHHEGSGFDAGGLARVYYGKV
tara:strand:+ start:58 stop:639 length:582 start_codon:yes stop_codon:yes gene_type:complete